MAKISIVVPIFDAGARIAEALESIRSQTYPLDELETIVVDGGSNDLCVRMARSFLQQHGMAGTVLVLDGNYGTGGMLNRGWRAASGDWIQILDSGDILASHKFETQIRQISRLPDVICSSWQGLSFSGGAWRPTGAVNMPGLAEPALLKVISLNASVLGPALFRKKSLESVGGFSDGVVRLSSGHLMLKLWGRGARFVEAPSPSPLYFVRATSDAMTGSVGVDLAHQHLQSVVVAEGMLRLQKSGALTREDRKEIANLCDESLSVLYEHDRAAFQQYWQWLRDVVPKYVPRASTKLKPVTVLGYEKSAASAFPHHWIKSRLGRAKSSISWALRRMAGLLREGLDAVLQPNLSIARSRFAGAALFALIAGFASLAAMLALGQLGGDARSAHPRLAYAERQDVNSVPPQPQSRILATNNRGGKNVPMTTSPMATASVPSPMPQRVDTAPSAAAAAPLTAPAEKRDGGKAVASAGARETTTGAIPTTAVIRSSSALWPTDSEQLAPPKVEGKSGDAATLVAKDKAKTEKLPVAPTEPRSSADPITNDVPLPVPIPVADRLDLASQPARASTKSAPMTTPEPPRATASLSPDTATPKPDDSVKTTPSGVAGPTAVAAARKPLRPSTAPGPTQVPADQAAKVGGPRAEPTAPAPTLTSQERGMAEKMLARGEREIENGNVAIARQFFLRAATAGLARGALLLATTYDPEELARLGAVSVQPDPAMARKWYERARALGAPEAQERLAKNARDCTRPGLSCSDQAGEQYQRQPGGH